MTELLAILGAAPWRAWWAWGLAAALFGILELLVPGYIFLGLSAAAAILAGLFLIGNPIAGLLPAGLPGLLLVFAVLSVLSWLGLRRAFRLPKGQIQVFRDDINED
jgi:membrane protein implicated in regulation of membrane protease activity